MMEHLLQGLYGVDALGDVHQQLQLTLHSQHLMRSAEVKFIRIYYGSGTGGRCCICAEQMLRATTWQHFSMRN